MTFWKPLRVAFIKTTDFTHGYQGAAPTRLLGFYRLWAPFYDASVGLDPAYVRSLGTMLGKVVRDGDVTLDVGSGTGLGSVRAASIAARVVAIDPSRDMTRKLERKIDARQIDNIEVRHGYFPDALSPGESFDSIISSFMLAHLEVDDRARAISAMFDRLRPGGRLGLFAARGEIAPTFQTRTEVERQIREAGFTNCEITDLADIYRIVTATRPNESDLAP